MRNISSDTESIESIARNPLSISISTYVLVSDTCVRLPCPVYRCVDVSECALVCILTSRSCVCAGAGAAGAAAGAGLRLHIMLTTLLVSRSLARGSGDAGALSDAARARSHGDDDRTDEPYAVSG